MDFHVGGGHVNVGGKDRHEKQRQAPAGEDLHLGQGNEQADATEQFENTTDLDAEEMKRNPGRHDGKKECGVE